MADLQRIDEALTSKKWRFDFLSSEECPRTLSEFIRKFLPHLEPESFNQRLELGGFFVNGIGVESDVALTPPCKVEYYEPKFDIRKAASLFPAFSRDWIIYDDSYFLAVYKPRRLPSLPVKEQRLYNMKRYLERNISPEIHMPSRLDTSTEGLLIASKNSRAHNYLQQAFEKRTIIKRYLLASENESRWEVKTVKNNITKDSRHPILRQVSDTEGKPAMTIFVKLTPSGTAPACYSARPLTGRTHQIRVHSAHLGIPILGDNFYGGAPAERLHLVSFQLIFWHPFLKRTLELSVPKELRPSWAKALEL